MKLKAISEALMWLPGFGPGEDPLSLSAPTAPSHIPDEVIAGPRTSLHAPVRAAPLAKPVWPRLESPVFEGLSGEATKFDANVAAIELLRVLESEGRAPTDDERVVLNRFTGWGGIPAAFNEVTRDDARRERFDRLKGLLSEQEYEAARASTPNAHFTSHEVVSAVWAAVQRMGFKGGRVLEPAAGNGYFIGAMPKEIAEQSTVTAVELEPTSARITKALYGGFGVRVLNEGFEKANLPDGFYDLVIGNVPFGNYQVPETRSVLYRNFLIHDYFIARAMDLVRPGGLVAVITSAGTLDKFDSKVRAYLDQQAKLVGVIRLPTIAFKAIAGTEVTTDLLIFQRRPSSALSYLDEWTQYPVVLGGDLLHEKHRFAKVHVNPIFRDHPEFAVGKFGLQGNGYGQSPAVFFDGDDFASALAERVAMLPERVYVPRADGPSGRELKGREYVVQAAEFVKPGAYVMHGDQLAVSEGHTLRIVEDSMQRAKVTRIKALIPVREAVRKLVAVQAATEDEHKVEAYRLALRATYDAFVAKHGFIHFKMNQLAFRDDPDFPLLLSLERWDEEEQVAEKADIFYRRTVGAYRRAERAGTPEEALLTCLAESARVIPSRIAELMEQPEDAVMAELLAKGLVFVEPTTANYEERSAYLSGNVRIKLAEAKAAGEGFEANVEALTAVIPADLSPQEIGARLGSTWIPADDYEAFCKEVLGSPATVTYNRVAGAWQIRGGSRWGVEATQTWGTRRADCYDLMEQALNQTTPRITDLDPMDTERKKRVVNTVETVAAREKQEAIKSEFMQWLWKDTDRAERLVRAYNDEFNSIAERKFDGSHLHLPGFSMVYTLHAHQKDAIWRAVSSGCNTLLAHVVGAGKTLTMICAAMEMRRTGLAAKPAFVVPNHMLEQFAAEFLRAYPTANVLLASKDDMAPDNRKVTLSRIATGDWDAVVITHASFERIPLGEKFVAMHIKEVIAECEMAVRMAQSDGDTRLVKQLERQKKVWEARLTKLARLDGKDDLLTFDELGIDQVSVDEAHAFKNLYRFTKMRVAGLPTNDSFRAFDMYLKTRYIMEKRGRQDGVVFATGTPIANSVAEMWVMQNYLQPRTLARLGLANFDSWAANFGEEVTALELAPDGSGYRMHTRFARFINVPELMAIYKEVADIRTAEMINLPVPEAIRETVTSPASEQLKAFVEQLVERADAIREGMVKPSEDNMLAVTNDGRKAATDMRLIGGCFDDPESKANRCVAKVLSVWESTSAEKGTQLVFLDQSTPNAQWNLYVDMRDKLIAGGIPAEQVAFIHDAATDAAKAKLFKAVREGRVRVMFGSTAKMGCGTNVQTRLVALHHMDAPWRPSDVEQREGRIIRQGNTWKVVRLYRYVTEGSFDAYVWQTLETKARFIAQVMSGDTSIRSIEDAELAALSYAEVKALASGNPLVIEKAGVDAEVMKLTMLRSQWEDQQWRNRREVADLPRRIARQKDLIAGLEADSEAFRSHGGPGVTLEVDGKVITDRKAIGDRIALAAASIRMNQRKTLGRICGLTLELDGGRSLLSPPMLYLVGQVDHEVGEAGKRGDTCLGRVEHALVNLETEANRSRNALHKMEGSLEAIRAVLDKPFEHTARLTALLARKAVIDRELGIGQSEKAEVETAEVAQAA